MQAKQRRRFSVPTVRIFQPGQNPMKSDNRHCQFAMIVAVIGVAYVMSQFFRMSNGGIA